MSNEIQTQKYGIPDQHIVVVSGLPRSGTSMMMKILQAGGITPVTDGQRQADENNPRGYYEFERVKQLPEGDTGWLDECQGKAVKIISALLKYLPGQHRYRIIFMQRSMSEILDSQRKMLLDRGKNPEGTSDQELAALFEKHNREALDWIDHQDHIECLQVNYNEILEAPEKSLKQVAGFLPAALDFPAMVDVVDQSLYRHRNRA